MKPRDVNFKLSHITLAGQEWGRPGDLPVIALHGWLDNCASFYRLAPLLENVHLIALDCAGHGLSGHRPAGAPYHIWEDVREIFEVADQLGWETFALMGHSRGAIISTLAAGTFPDRISHLGLIDGFRPTPVPTEKAPQQLARSIVELQQAPQRGFALYPEVEKAMMVRQRGPMALSEEAARQIVSRGLREVEGGYTWRSDPQLKIASGFKLTEAHSDAFVERITAPIHLIIAQDGMAPMQDYHEKGAARHPKVAVSRLAGSHHLHMEEQAPEVAEIFNRLWGSA